MSCIICNKSEEKKIFKNLTRCEGCGLIYYKTDSDDLRFNDLYQENYFMGEEYLDYKNDKQIIQKNFRCRLKEIKKHINKGTLFEIGCAYGFFLELAKKHYLVEGIDITKKPTEYARKRLGLNVKTGNYLDLKQENKKDIFCMWDTIEHLENPGKFINKISSELKTGGYLFLTTGDIGSMLAKIRGQNWRMIHPPTHLYYFSKKTISELLNKYGFEIIEITHPGVYRSLRQIVFSLFLLKKNKQLITKKIDNILDIPIYINTFDIMMVTARKK